MDLNSNDELENLFTQVLQESLKRSACHFYDDLFDRVTSVLLDQVKIIGDEYSLKLSQEAANKILTLAKVTIKKIGFQKKILWKFKVANKKVKIGFIGNKSSGRTTGLQLTGESFTVKVSLSIKNFEKNKNLIQNWKISQIKKIFFARSKEVDMKKL